MIASLGVKPLALSPTPSHTKLVGDVKEPTSLFEKSSIGDVVPSVVVWPVYMYLWLGARVEVRS